MLVAGFCTGLFMYLAGKLGLGKYLLMFPYVVTRGFYGGLGVTMIIAAWNMASLLKFDEFSANTGFGKMWTFDIIMKLLATTAFGISLRLVRNHQPKPQVFPLFMVGILALFYIILYATGQDIETARANDWVFKNNSKSSSSTAFYEFWGYYNPVDFDLSLLFSKGITSILSTVMLCAFDMALNLPALQDISEGEVDYDGEMRMAGKSALAGLAIGGGGVSYLTLSPTKINNEAGGSFSVLSSVMALLVAVLCFFTNSGQERERACMRA